MRQALVSTERGYDLIAPKFDHTPFRTPEGVLDGMMKVIAREPVRDALDVCCGTGAALRRLADVATGRVIGIDFSVGMLAEARRRVARDDVELVRGDALALPFESELDVVTCVGAFGHILPEDEDRFVSGIARALRPGGRFVFATGRGPKPTESWFWAAHAFNAVMRVRNILLRPEFIMYYLTFLWPNVRPLLERNGFTVTAEEGVCEAPYERVMIVSAVRTERAEKTNPNKTAGRK